MRNLQEHPITPAEVIEFLKDAVQIEEILEGAGVGGVDHELAQTALAVVRAASIIVQNDIGSTAADLLATAFNSQNIPPPRRETTEEREIIAMAG